MPRLTDTAVRGLKVQARTDFKDDIVPGLWLRVGAGDNGSKVWVARFRVGKAIKTVTLGKFPTMGVKDARIAAEAAKEQSGTEGATHGAKASKASKASKTIAEVAEDYIASAAFQRNKTANDRARTIRTSIIPHVGSIDVGEFTRKDAKDVIARYMDEGKESMARFVKQYLGAILNHAVEEQLIQFSPMAGMKMPAPVERRDRYLSKQELKDFWRYLNTEAANADPMRRAIRWIIATGQRKSECLFIHKSEIDLVERTWTLQGNRTKNGQIHVLPLTEWHIELLGEATKSGFYFVNPKTDELYNPRSLSHTVRDYNDMRNIVPNFTAHDLRRTMTTNLAELGVGLEDLKRVLNHTFGDVTSRHYNQFAYMEAKRAVMEKWRDYLRSL
ncbi:tyrosine-type recombinase/integrase [Azospirillum thermophilum]|nr:site-specific integrase [Azospirillum thermophilum]